MPKLIIHCEVTPPDNEVENVIESINAVQMMSSEDKHRLTDLILSLAEIMPDQLVPVVAVLSHAVLLVHGKTSTVHIKD